MANYKMIIAYDGTKYNGWQKLGHTKNTIQGLLEFVMGKMLNEEIEIHGSGRTDAGVHAKGQAANFHIQTPIKDLLGFLAQLNKGLPKDVAILSIEEEEERFHARLNAKRKTYEYRILNSAISNVFESRYVFQSSASLDVEKMKRAANAFVGRHDFKGFCANKRYKKSAERTIYSVNIVKQDDEIKIIFCGDGFLYNMVRIMAGTILQAGEGKLDENAVSEILLSKDRQRAGVTLPPQGLALVSVEY